MRKSLLVAGTAAIAIVAICVSTVSLLLVSAKQSSAAASGQLVPMVQNGSGQLSGIVVSGEGTITVQPDLARVTLGIEATNSTASGAQQDAAAGMDAVVTELKNQGIEDKDIKTVRFDLSPDYDYSTRTPVLKGYRVTNLVVVTLRDISKVGSLLDSVVASGATRLQGISFSVSDPAAAGTQGREAAMKDAKAKAEQLARLAGVSLGAPISIQETVSAPSTPMEMAQKSAAPMADAAIQTPISPGTQEIRTVINVTYSIQ